MESVHPVWVKVWLLKWVCAFDSCKTAGWLDSDAIILPELDFWNDPAHRPATESIVFPRLGCIFDKLVGAAALASSSSSSSKFDPCFLGYRAHWAKKGAECPMADCSCHSLYPSGDHHNFNAGCFLVRPPCRILDLWWTKRPNSANLGAWAGPGFEQWEFDAHLSNSPRVLLVRAADLCEQSKSFAPGPPFMHWALTGQFVGKSQIRGFIHDLLQCMSVGQRRALPCCLFLSKEFAESSASKAAVSQRTARGKNVSAIRRSLGVSIMVHGVRYKTINLAALATGIGRRTLQVRKRVALNHVRLFVNAGARMRS